MCGIAGVVDQVAPSQGRRLLGRLLATMVARGPDGMGEFHEQHVAMGMRRLAVIDLAGGTQPLFSQEGQVVAFQNGEIYNHAALRRELTGAGATFKTASDTEVLAHGYAHWGIDRLLAKLDGMYALAILDRRTGNLHLARDRFGEKPLFYTHKKGRFAYGSTLTALAQLPWVDALVDRESLDRYLALHFVPGRRTLFSGIYRVLPGERLTVSVRSLTIDHQRYHAPALNPITPVETTDLTRLLESAVTSRLIADVPVGVFLSGGLDSSVVAALAAKHHPAIDTFSMGFKDARYDESGHAHLVARAIGATHHHFTFDEAAFHDLLPTVAESLDEPIGDQALLPTYWLCREAKRHVTVVLSGEGADELFAGYDYYGSFLSQRSWRAVLKCWVQGRQGADSTRELCDNVRSATPSGFPLVMSAEDRRCILGTVAQKSDSWDAYLWTSLDRASHPLQRATLTDLFTWLPDDLLVKLDRMAMANSLEARAPFLYPALAETALCLPDAKRMGAGQSKVALREVAATLLPAEVVGRKKQGFVLPMGRWLREWLRRVGPLSDYFDLRHIPTFDAGAAAAIVTRELAAARPNERLLFSLVILTEWHRAFFGRQKTLAA